MSFVTFKICSGAHLSAAAPGESAQLWRANVKIQLHNLQGNSGLSLCIYLGFKRMCSCSSVDPSINPNIFPEWMRSFLTQQKLCLFRRFSPPCEAVRADVFKWLSAVVYDMYLFSEIQSKSKSNFSRLWARWEWYNSINVTHVLLRRLQFVRLESKLLHVLNYGMNVRW